MVASLLGEVILATKELNTKTRAAAYELLVQVGFWIGFFAAQTDPGEGQPVIRRVLMAFAGRRQKKAACCVAHLPLKGLFGTASIHGIVKRNPLLLESILCSMHIWCEPLQHTRLPHAHDLAYHCPVAVSVPQIAHGMDASAPGPSNLGVDIAEGPQAAGLPALFHMTLGTFRALRC